MQQLALLMHMYERDPLPVLPALSEAVVSCMRWQLALHIFNPGVAYALLDFNMLLGKHVAPPALHWSKAASAGNLTPDQLQSIGTLLGLVKPRLQVTGSRGCSAAGVVFLKAVAGLAVLMCVVVAVVRVCSGAAAVVLLQSCKCLQIQLLHTRSIRDKSVRTSCVTTCAAAC